MVVTMHKVERRFALSHATTSPRKIKKYKSLTRTHINLITKQVIYKSRRSGGLEIRPDRVTQNGT